MYELGCMLTIEVNWKAWMMIEDWIREQIV